MPWVIPGDVALFVIVIVVCLHESGADLLGAIFMDFVVVFVCFFQFALLINEQS